MHLARKLHHEYYRWYEARPANDPRAATARQQKLRAGLKIRLDQIEDHLAELPEIRQQIQALVALLGIELRQVSPEHRPR